MWQFFFSRSALRLCLWAVLTVGVADAASVSLDASKDNMLIESTTGALSNGAGDFFFAGNTGQFDSTIRRGLLAFDVAETVPLGATVNSVTLTLNMTRSASFDAKNVSLHRLQADWGEGTSDAAMGEGLGALATPGDATWLHTFFNTASWNTAGGDFDPTASDTQSVGGNGSYSWSSAELATDVQSWLDDPQGNFGWLLQGDESPAVATAKRFASRTHPTAALRPALAVDFTLALENHSWNTSEASQAWNTAANWDPTGIPLSSWDVTLENSSVPGGQEAVVNSDSTVHSALIRGTAGNMTVRVLNGNKLRTGGVTLEGDSTLDVDGRLVVPGEITVGNTGPASLVIQPDGRVESTQPVTIGGAGALSGAGTAEANLTNNGTVAPGLDGPGTLTVTGAFDQGSSGTLSIEIEGETPGIEHDVLSSTDLATLDGTLELLPTGDYVDPANRGDRETFLFLTTGAELSTTFSAVNYDGAALVADFSAPNGSFRSHAGDGLFRNLTYAGADAELSNYRALGGDANGDGTVNASGDGGILLANLGGVQGNKTWIDADFDGDGDTTASSDGAVLLTNLGQSADLAAVPEPGALGLLVICAAILGGASRGRRSRD